MRLFSSEFGKCIQRVYSISSSVCWQLLAQKNSILFQDNHNQRAQEVSCRCFLQQPNKRISFLRPNRQAILHLTSPHLNYIAEPLLTSFLRLLLTAGSQRNWQLTLTQFLFSLFRPNMFVKINMLFICQCELLNITPPQKKEERLT